MRRALSAGGGEVVVSVVDGEGEDEAGTRGGDMVGWRTGMMGGTGRIGVEITEKIAEIGGTEMIGEIETGIGTGATETEGREMIDGTGITRTVAKKKSAMKGRRGRRMSTELMMSEGPQKIATENINDAGSVQMVGTKDVTETIVMMRETVTGVAGMMIEDEIMMTDDATMIGIDITTDEEMMTVVVVMKKRIDDPHVEIHIMRNPMRKLPDGIETLSAHLDLIVVVLRVQVPPPVARLPLLVTVVTAVVHHHPHHRGDDIAHELPPPVHEMLIDTFPHVGQQKHLLLDESQRLPLAGLDEIVLAETNLVKRERDRYLLQVDLIRRLEVL